MAFYAKSLSTQVVTDLYRIITTIYFLEPTNEWYFGIINETHTTKTSTRMTHAILLYFPLKVRDLFIYTQFL